jgi:hypothetical protein
MEGAIRELGLRDLWERWCNDLGGMGKEEVMVANVVDIGGTDWEEA